MTWLRHALFTGAMALTVSLAAIALSHHDAAAACSRLVAINDPAACSKPAAPKPPPSKPAPAGAQSRPTTSTPANAKTAGEGKAPASAKAAGETKAKGSTTGKTTSPFDSSNQVITATLKSQQPPRTSGATATETSKAKRSTTGKTTSPFDSSNQVITATLKSQQPPRTSGATAAETSKARGSTTGKWITKAPLGQQTGPGFNSQPQAAAVPFIQSGPGFPPVSFGSSSSQPSINHVQAAISFSTLNLPQPQRTQRATPIPNFSTLNLPQAQRTQRATPIPNFSTLNLLPQRKQRTTPIPNFSTLNLPPQRKQRTTPIPNFSTLNLPQPQRTQRTTPIPNFSTLNLPLPQPRQGTKQPTPTPKPIPRQPQPTPCRYVDGQYRCGPPITVGEGGLCHIFGPLKEVVCDPPRPRPPGPNGGPGQGELVCGGTGVMGSCQAPPQVNPCTGQPLRHPGGLTAVCQAPPQVNPCTGQPLRHPGGLTAVCQAPPQVNPCTGQPLRHPGGLTAICQAPPGRGIVTAPKHPRLTKQQRLKQAKNKPQTPGDVAKRQKRAAMLPQAPAEGLKLNRFWTTLAIGWSPWALNVIGQAISFAAPGEGLRAFAGEVVNTVGDAVRQLLETEGPPPSDGCLHVQFIGVGHLVVQYVRC
jgi:hypothetical protein